MKIGVFDSGVGGLSVASAIEKAFPEHKVIFKNDAEHMPYAVRSPEEILPLVTPVMQSLVDEGCQVIVVACNTVSTTLIEPLREQFDVPLISVEPLMKLASEMTKTDVIAVCATPTTLASAHYAMLKETYTSQCTVIEPDCSNWSLLIEHHDIEEQHIADCIKPALDAGADVIVLGCTHYHWIEEEIAALASDAVAIIQPEAFIIEELTQVLEQLQ